MNCKECGTRVAKADRFCRNCAFLVDAVLDRYIDNKLSKERWAERVRMATFFSVVLGLLSWFGFQEFKDYREFANHKIASLESELNGKVEATAKRFDDELTGLKKTGDIKLGVARKDLGQQKELVDKAATISDQMERNTKALSAEVEKSRSVLADFASVQKRMSESEPFNVRYSSVSITGLGTSSGSPPTLGGLISTPQIVLDDSTSKSILSSWPRTEVKIDGLAEWKPSIGLPPTVILSSYGLVVDPVKDLNIGGTGIIQTSWPTSMPCTNAFPVLTMISSNCKPQR